MECWTALGMASNIVTFTGQVGYKKFSLFAHFQEDHPDIGELSPYALPPAEKHKK